MKLNKTSRAWVLAAAFAIGIPATVSQALATPLFQQDQRPEPDYTNNKTYQQGQRDGQADRKRNLDHSKKRHFKKDDDQKAYEAGYQKARNN